MSRQLNVEVQVKQQDSQAENNEQKNVHKQIEQQEQQDEPQYKVQKMLPKITQKQKLIQQNIKLKTQIYQLAKQLDEILIRDKTKKKKYGINVEDDDETVKTKKLQLKKQQLQIMQMKNKIFVVKRQLQSVYNNRTVLSKQDELKHLKLELKVLQQEKQGLLKVKKEQSKALKILKNQEQYQQRIQNLKKQLQKVKQQSKTLGEKVNQSEKILRKNHELYIMKQLKVKELEQKLATNKQRAKNRKPVQTITPQMITQLEEEINKLEKEKKQGQKIWQDKIRAIDSQLHQKRLQQEKKLLILKEKEKQLKLNELRIKQLRKLIRHNAQETNTKKGEEADMSQYRHRRNIRYLEK